MPVCVLCLFGCGEDIHPCYVSTVFLDCAFQSEDRAFGFAHLLPLQGDEAVYCKSFWPVFFFKEGYVVEEEEEQVVRDKVLSGRAQVHRIPVIEITADFFQDSGVQASLCGNSC